MNNLTSNITKRLLGAVMAAALITPGIAMAQDVSYADGGSQQIQGTVSSIDGTWNLTVDDSNGYTDNIALHQGTIINPTGLTLEPGMSVTIDGYADGQSFDAMEIDTPYQYDGPAPTAVYYGGGAWYPGYAQGWGPSFSLFFNVNTRSYERRSFYVGGQFRRPQTPPEGWQNRPHGFIGNAGNERNFARTTSFRSTMPTQRFDGPRTGFAPQQQQRNFAPQQQQRTFAQPQQQQRAFAQPQQQRNFAPQQQQRTFAQPQQQRNFAPQARSAQGAPRAAQSGPRNGGERRR